MVQTDRERSGVFLVFISVSLTCLSGGVRTRSEFGRRWWRSGRHVIGAAAQPLLLFAERDHFGAKLLVRRSTYEPTIHVLGLDVGFNLMSVRKRTRIIFCFFYYKQTQKH